MEETRTFWNYFSNLWRNEKKTKKEYLTKKAKSPQIHHSESSNNHSRHDSPNPIEYADNHTNGVQNDHKTYDSTDSAITTDSNVNEVQNHNEKTVESPQNLQEPSNHSQVHTNKSNSVIVSSDLPTPRPKLYRHLTCSIDLSDRSFKLTNTYQFKSIDGPNLQERRPSIDLETIRDNLGQLEPYSNFEELDTIGTGAFGRAVKVRHIKTDRLFVMKEVLTQSKDDEESLRKEVGLLRRLNHENILVLEGLVLKDKKICLLTELMENGNLQVKILDLTLPLSVVQKVQFLLDIAAGMEYLHSNSIMHRDLTSLNCLLSKTNRVVVSDFGLSKFFVHLNSRKHRRNRRTIFNFPTPSVASSKSHEELSGSPKDSSLLQIPSLQPPLFNDNRRERHPLELSVSVGDNLHCVTPNSPDNPLYSPSTPDVKQNRKFSSPMTPDVAQGRRFSKHRQLSRKHTQVGSPFWMAPEMMANNKYSPQVDLYSFGVIGCEVTGRVNSEPDVLERRTKDMSVDFPAFLQTNSPELQNCPASLMEMISLCCEPKPEMRPSFSQCVSWLEDIKFKLTTDYPINIDWFPEQSESDTESGSI